MITCRLLGPLELLLDDAPAPAELLWRKHSALLIYLALSPGRRRARSHLVGLLWGDRAEGAARHSLSEALRVIRRAEPHTIEAEGDIVALGPDAVRLDTERFDALSRDGRWREAAELVRGGFLEGFGLADGADFEEWLAAERRAWQGKMAGALARAAAQDSADGQPGRAVPFARRGLELDPLSDPAARAVMRTAALAEQRAFALETFAAFAARLEAELGTAPEPETTALAERIRAGRIAGRSTSAPGAGTTRPALPFVGRSDELHRLLDQWEAARVGAARLLLIEGDAGVGRTRLAEEVARRAALDHATVVTARAVAGDRGEPWSTLWALASGELSAAPGVAGASTPALGTFAERFPEWADRFPATRGATPLSPGRAFAEVAGAAASERPVLLVVDDAQFSDRESLRAFAALLRDLSRAPLALLLTRLSSTPALELDELVAPLGREVHGTVAALHPLDGAAIGELAAAAFPGLDPEQQARIGRRALADSAGFPFFAIALLEAIGLGMPMPDAKAWPEAGRTLDQTLTAELPPALLAAVRTRAALLSPVARHALGAVALAGERVHPAALAEATGIPPGELETALDELETGRWLEWDPRGYSLVARMMREMVAADLLTPGQRRRLEERLGHRAPN